MEWNCIWVSKQVKKKKKRKRNWMFWTNKLSFYFINSAHVSILNQAILHALYSHIAIRKFIEIIRTNSMMSIGCKDSFAIRTTPKAVDTYTLPRINDITFEILYSQKIKVYKYILINKGIKLLKLNKYIYVLDGVI